MTDYATQKKAFTNYLNGLVTLEEAESTGIKVIRSTGMIWFETK